MPDTISKPMPKVPGSFGSHILDELLQMFGGHLTRGKDPLEQQHSNEADQDPEDFKGTEPEGLKKTDAGAITHPKLKILMAKLSPEDEGNGGDDDGGDMPFGAKDEAPVPGMEQDDEENHFA